MPNKKGFNLILWILPFILVALAAIVIYFLIRRWSSRISLKSAARFTENQLDEYQERLEKELKHFD
jgi:cytochrome c-type biogenesis protein CcmH